MITVVFEDHGQDFLEWDIEGGIVVACRPFQTRFWVGKRVHNKTIGPGDKLTISSDQSPVTMVVRHAVKEVKEAAR